MRWPVDLPTSRTPPSHVPDRLGRCADFTSQSFARTGDATAGYYLRGNQGGRRGDGKDGGGGPNKNLEFQYKVDTDELREFQLVDSSKAYGGASMVGDGGGMGGGDVKRFVPQARRRANATRLRQINQRRNDDKQGQVGGRTVQPAPADKGWWTVSSYAVQ